MAVGGNSFSRPLQNICPQNQPSLSSTSRSAYEIIHRSESGSGYSNSLRSLEHRRHRARAERTWNRRAEPDESGRFRDFLVRPERKQREPTSRPILIDCSGRRVACILPRPSCPDSHRSRHGCHDSPTGVSSLAIFLAKSDLISDPA